MADGGRVPNQPSMTLIKVAGNDKAPVGGCWPVVASAVKPSRRHASLVVKSNGQVSDYP